MLACATEAAPQTTHPFVHQTVQSATRSTSNAALTGEKADETLEDKGKDREEERRQGQSSLLTIVAVTELLEVVVGRDRREIAKAPVALQNPARILFRRNPNLFEDLGQPAI